MMALMNGGNGIQTRSTLPHKLNPQTGSNIFPGGLAYSIFQPVGVPNIYILENQPGTQLKMKKLNGKMEKRDQSTQTMETGPETLRTYSAMPPPRGILGQEFDKFLKVVTDLTASESQPDYANVIIVREMLKHLEFVARASMDDYDYVCGYALAQNLNIPTARTNIMMAKQMGWLCFSLMKDVTMVLQENQFTEPIRRTPSPDLDILRPPYCPFCRKTGRPKTDYRTHDLHDIITGVTTCPYLRKYVCKFCGACGNSAHTASYCPWNPNAKPEIQEQTQSN